MSEDPRATWGTPGGGPIARRTKPPSSLDTATKPGRLGAAVRPVSVVAWETETPNCPVAAPIRKVIGKTDGNEVEV
jgi:hypothetical protein